jgi:hypothetical protein
VSVVPGVVQCERVEPVITVLSAIYGAYDEPIAPPVQDIPVRWVMVTDGQVTPPEPWEHIIEPRPDLQPRMASRFPKCLALHYGDGGPVLWLDGCATIQTETFVSDMIASLADGDVAMWTHPHRYSISHEALAASGLNKYHGQPLHEQVRQYLMAGHPDDYGLWACTSMLWAPHVPLEVGAAWWVEQQEWGDMDQLAWPVIVRRFGLDVRPFPGSLYDGERVVWRKHPDR